MRAHSPAAGSNSPATGSGGLDQQSPVRGWGSAGHSPAAGSSGRNPPSPGWGGGAEGRRRGAPRPVGGAAAAARRRGWDLAVAALILAYIAFFGTWTVLKHQAFQTTAFDLGNVDQAVWNTRHGRPLAMTNIEGLTNRLGTHVEPILLPMALLYFVWSDPRALLLAQTVILALGAWPLYRLARRLLSAARPDSWLAGGLLPVTFAAVYLLFPALQSANLFDFHAVALAPTFFLAALYCLETERLAGVAAFALLTMSCKEDMPLLVAMLGVYALAARRGRVRWMGLATLIVALAWFLAAVGWVMPHFDTSEVSPLAGRYRYLGDGPVEMARTLLTRPGLVLEHLRQADALGYLARLLTPVAFLSLLAPQVLILAAPPLAVNLLSTDGFMHQLEGFHYGVPLAPVVVASAAYGAAWLLRRFRCRALPALLVLLLLTASAAYHWRHGYTPLSAGFRDLWPTVTPHHRLGQEMAGRIPPDASLAALPYLNPHASQRQRLSMIDRVEDGRPAPLHDADYVWLDVTQSWPLHPNDLKAAVETLLAGDYGVEEAVDGWLLLRKGAPQRTVPDAFYDFARAPDPQPETPMRLRFLLDGKPVVECLGLDLHANRRLGTHSLTLYWRALESLPEALVLHPFFLDDATGQVLEDTSLRPMIETVWYPPSRWKPGEVVQTRTLPWTIGPDFSVGLGISRSGEWEETGSRLPIVVESSELVIRLFDGDTWARLLHVEDGKPVEERRRFALPAPQHPLDADFGPIRLLGFDLGPDGRTTQLTLYWQAEERPTVGYTVFVQWLDPSGTVVAQWDSAPQQGGYSTRWWLPGEVVADAVTLPRPAAGAETYRLIAGLYDPATGVRLSLAGSGADYVELMRVSP